jgi:hypothetical protein
MVVILTTSPAEGSQWNGRLTAEPLNTVIASRAAAWQSRRVNDAGLCSPVWIATPRRAYARIRVTLAMTAFIVQGL